MRFSSEAFPWRQIHVNVQTETSQNIYTFFECKTIAFYAVLTLYIGLSISPRIHCFLITVILPSILIHTLQENYQNDST